MADVNNQLAVLVTSVSGWNEMQKQVAQIAQTVEMLKANADSKGEFLTPKEACQMLKIGRATFQRHKASGVIPVYSIAGTKRKYAKKSEVLRLLHEGKF